MSNLDVARIDTMLRDERFALVEAIRLNRKAQQDQIRRERFLRHSYLLGLSSRGEAPEKTSELLVEIAYWVREGGNIPERIRPFLADALIAIAKKPSRARAAFGFSKPSHRPKNARTSHRNLHLAQAVHDHVARARKFKHRATTRPVEKAIDAVAKLEGLSIATVRKAWSEWKDYVRC